MKSVMESSQYELLNLVWVEVVVDDISDGALQRKAFTGRVVVEIVEDGRKTLWKKAL